MMEEQGNPTKPSDRHFVMSFEVPVRHLVMSTVVQYRHFVMSINLEDRPIKFVILSIRWTLNNVIYVYSTIDIQKCQNLLIKDRHLENVILLLRSTYRGCHLNQPPD